MKARVGSKDSGDQALNGSLEKALALCYKLRLSEAEAALSEILSTSRNADSAHSALALVELLQGRPSRQIDILKEILGNNPNHYQALHQLALAMYRAGNYAEADEYASRALIQEPDNARSLLLASTICLSLGNQKQASRLAQKVLELKLGWRRQASNLLAQAWIDSIDSSSQHQALVELIKLITTCQGDAVRLEVTCRLITETQAEEEYIRLSEASLHDQPDNFYLRLLRVRLLSSAGRHDETFPDLYYLLSIEPDSHEVLHSFAESLLSLKRWKEALQVCLGIARNCGTDFELLNQIGVCYRHLGKFRSAEKAYWRSIRLNPINPLIIGNLGELYFRYGDKSRSLELYTIALNINPLSTEVFYNKMLSYSVGTVDGLAGMRAEAALYWTLYKEVHSLGNDTLTTTKRIISKAPNKDCQIQQKVRISFLSSDVGDHCVSYFLTAYLRNFNKDAFQVDLILCDRRYEEKEKEICSYADNTISLAGLSEQKARELIQDQNYDVIIECNGYTGGSGISLLAERCAPIQCHYIGYHASTGLDTIDYFISDSHILSPSVVEQLSEKPIMLDRAWLAFASFEEFPQAKSIATSNRPLLGFFGNSTKITDVTLEYWSALFSKCKEAILVLKCLSYQDSFIIERVVKRIEEAGIDRGNIAIIQPTASWLEHVDYYNLIDYALDSTPWSSATTGFDALGMGVPLLAIEGKTIASRMSSSLVTHLGRTEWLATSPADYAQFGQTISHEFMQVREQKGKLQIEVQSSSLFDGLSLARSLELALMDAIRSADDA